jgi:hypothetical protein
MLLPKPPNRYILGSRDMASNRARPEQGGTASNVDFLKMISMVAFDLKPTFTLRTISSKKQSDEERGAALFGFG